MFCGVRVLANETMERKLDHIEIVLEKDVVFQGLCSSWYSQIKLIHQAYPGVNYSDVDTSVNFLGRTLKYPLMITGMTGGHRDTIDVNRKLARIASKYGIAIGVGSQRAMAEDSSEEIQYSYKVVREEAREVPVIGNIGFNSLSKLGVKKVIDIVNSLGADALAVHLNAAQELIQPEGDTFFNEELLGLFKDLVKGVGVPVIVKEVGNGLSMETVSIFHGLGVMYFDVAGACGTNWVLVEKYRAEKRGNKGKTLLAEKLSSWGIPTPLSVIEARWAAPSSWIIASGGVWDGFRAALNIALGANMAGLALPILRALLKGGIESAEKFIENYVMELKAVMFLTGSSDISDLRRKPLYISDYLQSLLTARGIMWSKYMEIKGC